MTAPTRLQLLVLTCVAFAAAIAGTVFCVVQIVTTAWLPDGDGTGMQWIVLAPLAMLFFLLVAPASVTGVRGLRLLRAGQPADLPRALPSTGWLVATGVLAVYVLAPFIVAPILGLLLSE